MVYMPTYNLAGVDIADQREVYKTTPGAQVGNIGYPSLMWRRNCGLLQLVVVLIKCMIRLCGNSIATLSLYQQVVTT